MHRFLRILVLVGCLSTASHALFLGQGIQAFRVKDGLIKTDGEPDSVWKAIAAISQGSSTVAFNNYGNIVLLESVSMRNDDPAKYYQAPSQGLITLLAAYDAQALYFFFLVKENTAFDSRARCGAADKWRADAAEVFLDPSAWSESLYKAYFSADAGSLTFGTSAKTIQVDKPIFLQDTAVFYRDRSKNDRFETRPRPSGILAATARSVSDAMTMGVEIKIPFWGGNNTAFQSGSSMFISWGYNHYLDTSGAGCSENPVAYRWAKHYKTYLPQDEKPPGWSAQDTTHYDPLRSWDGWGRFSLNPKVANENVCKQLDVNSWDLEHWKKQCLNDLPVSIGEPDRPRVFRTHPISAGKAPAHSPGRDSRGRRVGSGMGIFFLPDQPLFRPWP